MFSLDDCNEYRADFVLATLLDAAAPRGSLSHATSTVAAAKKKVQNGFHHEGKAATHSTHVDDEDCSLGDFTHAHIPPVSRAKGGKHAGAEGHPSTHESLSNRTSVAGTSASSGSSRNHTSSAANSRGTCVPTPPQANFKASEYQDSFSRTNSRSHDSSHGLSRGDYAAIGEDYDLMDALFETENFTDVAEDGGRFGFACEGQKGVGSKGKEKASTGGQRTKKHGGGQLEERMDSGKQTGGSSHMQDEFFADDFPYEGECETHGWLSCISF